MKSLCVAIIPKKNCVYLFDSHSRNNFGQPASDGYSSLMKFKNKRDLEIYFYKTYFDQTTKNEQFEIQYISIEQPVEAEMDFSLIYSSKINRKRKATKQEQDKAQKRMATEANKEKSRNRNQSEVNKEKGRKRKAANKSKKNDFASNNDCISAFQKAIQNGPYYVCNVCNRNLYKKTVKYFRESNYKLSLQHVFTNVVCFDSFAYICMTCDKYLKKSEIPPQAVWNKLEVFDLPDEIRCLNRLEQILISKRILFKKIAVMPK